jgi:cellulose biosynthesis protein BcsQ
MKVVSFFNTKGGIGKATLTCNLAAHLARKGLRVVVVDLDPHCNATNLMLGEERAASLYWDELESAERNTTTTLWTILVPIALGDPTPGSAVAPVPGQSNRFGVDLVPGHPRASLVEDRLSQAWRHTLGGDSEGLRKTNWLVSMARGLAPTYDLMILDLGPNLGSLNRTALLASDYFVTPMDADVFGMLGLRCLSNWLAEWTAGYLRAVNACQRTTPGAINRFGLAASLPVLQGFAGYTTQRSAAKFKRDKRLAGALEQITSFLDAEVNRDLGRFFAEGVSSANAMLGEIPNLFSMLPLAQSSAAPIIDLNSSDGLVGSHYHLKARCVEALDAVAIAFAHNIALGVDA